MWERVNQNRIYTEILREQNTTPEAHASHKHTQKYRHCRVQWATTIFRSAAWVEWSLYTLKSENSPYLNRNWFFSQCFVDRSHREHQGNWTNDAVHTGAFCKTDDWADISAPSIFISIVHRRVQTTKYVLFAEQKTISDQHKSCLRVSDRLMWRKNLCKMLPWLR